MLQVYALVVSDRWLSLGPFPLSVGTIHFTTACVDPFTDLLLATPTRNIAMEQIISFFSKYILSHSALQTSLTQIKDLTDFS